MKIGLVSLPMTWNYGGILQQYALQKLLQDHGHDVEVLTIRKDRKNWLLNYIVAIKWQMIKMISKTGLKGINKLIDTEYYKRQFPGKISKSLFTDSEIAEYIRKKKLQCLIVGSDQIWNRAALANIKASFLDYPVKFKIAYAPSFAKSSHEYNEDEIEFVINALKEFNYVSVREKTGRDILKNIFLMESEVVLDPTLLLKIDDYSVKEIDKANSIFTYVLDSSEKLNSCINCVSKLLNLEVNDFVRNSGYKGVEVWLSGIKNSRFVLTDSFHGFCFSILSNTDFIVIRNKLRGSDRFDSLAELLGLTDRIINNDELHKINDIVSTPIDWCRVNNAIKTYSTESSKFLKCLK